MADYQWKVEICDRGSGKSLFNQPYETFGQISDRLNYLSGELPTGYFIRVSPPPEATTTDQLEKLKTLGDFEIIERAKGKR